MMYLYRFQYYLESTEPFTSYVLANSWPNAFNVLIDRYKTISIITAEQLAIENKDLFISNDILAQMSSYVENTKIPGYDQFNDPEFRIR